MLPIRARRPGLCNRLPVCDPEIGEISTSFHGHHDQWSSLSSYIILLIHDHLLNLLWAPFRKRLPPPPEEQHAVAFSLLTSMIIIFVMIVMIIMMKIMARIRNKRNTCQTSSTSSLVTEHSCREQWQCLKLKRSCLWWFGRQYYY